MRTASTLVGAPRAPDIDAQQRGGRRLSSSTNTPANHDHVPRTVTPTQTLLDRRRPAALPQNRSHLTHGTCRSAKKRGRQPPRSRLASAGLVPRHSKSSEIPTGAADNWPSDLIAPGR